MHPCNNLVAKDVVQEKRRKQFRQSEEDEIPLLATRDDATEVIYLLAQKAIPIHWRMGPKPPETERLPPSTSDQVHIPCITAPIQSEEHHVLV